MLKYKDIDKIGKCLENKDKIELIKICNESGMNFNEEFRFDEICYGIMEQIENDESLIQYFKEISKEKKIYRQLLVYLKKIENIRYFIDNKEQYDLDWSYIQKMEEEFHKGYCENNKKTSNEWLISSIISIIIFCIFTIFIFKPYFETYITKKTIITDAIVLEEEHWIHNMGRKVRVKYEYYVNDTKYTTEKLFSGGILKYLEKHNTLKIYYYKDNPAKSERYLKISENWLSVVGCIFFDACVFIGSIKIYRDEKCKRSNDSKVKKR